MNAVNRREFLKWSAAGAAALALPKWSVAAGPTGAKPNFVHVVLDDWGYYEASCMGQTRAARQGRYR
jgi:hypothetical protein